MINHNVFWPLDTACMSVIQRVYIHQIKNYIRGQYYSSYIYITIPLDLRISRYHFCPKRNQI